MSLLLFLMIPLLKTEVVLAVVVVMGFDGVVAGFIIYVDVDVVDRAKGSLIAIYATRGVCRL